MLAVTIGMIMVSKIRIKHGKAIATMTKAGKQKKKQEIGKMIRTIGISPSRIQVAKDHARTMAIGVRAEATIGIRTMEIGVRAEAMIGAVARLRIGTRVASRKMEAIGSRIKAPSGRRQLAEATIPEMAGGLLHRQAMKTKVASGAIGRALATHTVIKMIKMIGQLGMVAENGEEGALSLPAVIFKNCGRSLLA